MPVVGAATHQTPAVLIAVDARPASYAWQLGSALEEGVTPEEIQGVLLAVAPQVGIPRVVAAATEIKVALGLGATAHDTRTAWNYPKVISQAPIG